MFRSLPSRFACPGSQRSSIVVSCAGLREQFGLSLREQSRPFWSSVSVSAWCYKCLALQSRCLVYLCRIRRWNLSQKTYRFFRSRLRRAYRVFPAHIPSSTLHLIFRSSQPQSFILPKGRLRSHRSNRCTCSAETFMRGPFAPHSCVWRKVLHDLTEWR